jgi:FAD/FMN-containing dehydrogenase
MTATATSLLVCRLGYYRRALASAVTITRTAIRHGAPVLSVLPDRDFGNSVDKGGQREEIACGGDAAAAALARARAAGRKIQIAGSCHSSAGQTLTGDGIRLRLEPDPAEAAIWLDSSRLQVPASWRWRQVEALANAQGRTIPVLTDNLDTRVGGTLSVGGIGTRSIEHGRQIDWVAALDLILPDGSRAHCSPTEQPDLFRCALGGLGQLGIMERAVLETRPHRPFVASFKYQMASLQEAARLAAGALDAAPLPQHFEVVGPQIGSRYIHLRIGYECDDAAAAAELVKRPPCWPGITARLLQRRVESTLRFTTVNVQHVQHYIASLRGAAHLWNDWLFTEPAAYEAFVRFIEQALLPRLGTRDLVAGLILRLARRAGRPHSPLSYARDAGGPVFHLGLYYSVAAGQEERRRAVAAGLAEAQQAARDRGGRLYLHGWHRYGAAEWNREFGADHAEMLAMKHKLDADFLLNSDILIS